MSDLRSIDSGDFPSYSVHSSFSNSKPYNHGGGGGGGGITNNRGRLNSNESLEKIAAENLANCLFGVIPAFPATNATDEGHEGNEGQEGQDQQYNVIDNVCSSGDKVCSIIDSSVAIVLNDDEHHTDKYGIDLENLTDDEDDHDDDLDNDHDDDHDDDLDNDHVDDHVNDHDNHNKNKHEQIDEQIDDNVDNGTNLENKNNGDNENSRNESLLHNNNDDDDDVKNHSSNDTKEEGKEVEADAETETEGSNAKNNLPVDNGNTVAIINQQNATKPSSIELGFSPRINNLDTCPSSSSALYDLPTPTTSNLVTRNSNNNDTSKRKNDPSLSFSISEQQQQQQQQRKQKRTKARRRWKNNHSDGNKQNTKIKNKNSTHSDIKIVQMAKEETKKKSASSSVGSIDSNYTSSDDDYDHDDDDDDDDGHDIASGSMIFQFWNNYRQVQAQHVIDMKQLRKIVTSGIVEEGSHRAVAWRVLFGYIPVETDQWEKVLKEKRKLYTDIVQNLFVHTTDVEDGSPLRGNRNRQSLLLQRQKSITSSSSEDNKQDEDEDVAVNEDHEEENDEEFLDRRNRSRVYSSESAHSIDFELPMEFDEFQQTANVIGRRTSSASQQQVQEYQEQLYRNIPKQIREYWLKHSKDLRILERILNDKMNALKVNLDDSNNSDAKDDDVVVVVVDETLQSPSSQQKNVLEPSSEELQDDHGVVIQSNNVFVLHSDEGNDNIATDATEVVSEAESTDLPRNDAAVSPLTDLSNSGTNGGVITTTSTTTTATTTNTNTTTTDGDAGHHINKNSINNEAKLRDLYESVFLLDEIHKDVVRTHPDLAFFLEPAFHIGRRRYAAIERILFVWSKYNKGVKYVQGMNEIIGILYYVLANDANDEWSTYAEPDAYWLLDTLLSEMQDVFVADLDHTNTGIQGRIQAMEALLGRHDPEVKEHLDDLNLEVSYYAIRWWTTLLSREFVLPDTIRLWDSMFASTHKDNFLRYVCVTMIMSVRDTLLSGDFATCLRLLQSYPSTHVDQLLESTRALWLYESQITVACHRGGISLHQALTTIQSPPALIMAFGLRNGKPPVSYFSTNSNSVNSTSSLARAAKEHAERAKNQAGQTVAKARTSAQGIFGRAFGMYQKYTQRSSQQNNSNSSTSADDAVTATQSEDGTTITATATREATDPSSSSLTIQLPLAESEASTVPATVAAETNAATTSTGTSTTTLDGNQIVDELCANTKNILTVESDDDIYLHAVLNA